MQQQLEKYVYNIMHKMVLRRIRTGERTGVKTGVK